MNLAGFSKIGWSSGDSAENIEMESHLMTQGSRVLLKSVKLNTEDSMYKLFDLKTNTA